jgi:hypothetical protein
VIQKTSALTFTVSGNFKVVLSIVISVLIFKNQVCERRGRDGSEKRRAKRSDVRPPYRFLTILLFLGQITYLNGIGCAAAVVGCFWYSHLRMEANKKPSLPLIAPSTSSSTSPPSSTSVALTK